MTIDPAEVESLGKALGVRAEAIAAARKKLTSNLAQLAWSGTGASRFRFDAAQLDRQLTRDSDELARLMASFQRLAEALEEELLAIRNIEARVRAWLALNPMVPPPWPPSSLPPPGDPQWREVEQAFMRAGVALDAVPVSASSARVLAAEAATPSGDWKATLSPAEAFIIQRESNFDPTAVNPDSGAFGIWQGLGSTLDTYANRFGFDRQTTDPWEQLTMFRAYIKDRYTTAEEAVGFWEKNHWY